MGIDLTVDNFNAKDDINKEQNDNNKNKDELTSNMECELIKSIYVNCISENYNGIDAIIDKKYTREDIIKDKKQRECRRKWLIKDYLAPLLSMKVNYPGVCKNNYVSFRIMKIFGILVINEFKDKIMYKDLQVTSEGPVLTLVINDDVCHIKKRVIEIEESHVLGKCIDMEVYNSSGIRLSRKKLGFEPKKCYMCHGEVYNCIKNKTHDINEMKKCIKDELEKYLKDNKLNN
ncbi:citrate lyase holo-[acyl-carrier protein] synthase [Clostridium sp. WILCCON 0269]|uniref:citrate lyase holo-[acyl-carrier protein] synthase n=1 Tax=Candidatus Clostridium eludens TaxID=3381663 RepID=A0ABW8SJB7_9CLOT